MTETTRFALQRCKRVRGVASGKAAISATRKRYGFRSLILARYRQNGLRTTFPSLCIAAYDALFFSFISFAYHLYNVFKIRTMWMQQRRGMQQSFCAAVSLRTHVSALTVRPMLNAYPRTLTRCRSFARAWAPQNHPRPPASAWPSSSNT